MSYWNDWEKAAEAYLSGQTDVPPESPKTREILLLVKACKEVDRVLRDPHSTASMPQTHKLIKKALGKSR